jgi:hypothetical protein
MLQLIFKIPYFLPLFMHDRKFSFLVPSEHHSFWKVSESLSTISQAFEAMTRKAFHDLLHPLKVKPVNQITLLRNLTNS